jgi:S1-C subfamily serine protease
MGGPSTALTAAGAVFVQLGFHGLIEPGGLRVAEIRQGSPAQRSGLRTGDLIVRVNNQTFNVQDVTGTILPLITNLRPVLTVMRDGQQITILIVPPVVVVTTTPTPFRPPTVIPLPPQRTQLGVGYDVVTAALADERKLSVNYGALVTAVTPRSPADMAGIKVGDIITAVDGDKVDVKHTLVFRMMPYNVGDTVTLTVVRGTETVQILVTLVLPGRASNSIG